MTTVDVELTNLVTAPAIRHTSVRHVMLNNDAWDSHPHRIQIGGRVVRVGWFATLDGSLLIADTDNDRRVDLLVVPFDTTPVLARTAMDLASTGPATLDAVGVAATTGPDPSAPGGTAAVDTARRSAGP